MITCPNVPLIQHNTVIHQSTDAHRDEGMVVTETLNMSRTLTAHEDVHISIYAINKVSNNKKVTKLSYK